MHSGNTLVLDLPADNFDYQPLAFGPAYPYLAKPLQYALGFLSGLVACVSTPASTRRAASRQRWSGQWRGWVRGLLHVQGHAVPVSPRAVELRSALLGHTRAQVVTALGPPPASSAAPWADSASAQASHYWHADTWYYPVDPIRRHAIAVTFSHDRAQWVDFFTGPSH